MEQAELDALIASIIEQQDALLVDLKKLKTDPAIESSLADIIVNQRKIDRTIDDLIEGE